MWGSVACCLCLDGTDELVLVAVTVRLSVDVGLALRRFVTNRDSAQPGAEA